MKDRVCDRIKQRREQLNMSVDDLAAAIGKNRATVYRYENGEIDNMPLKVLESIAIALNCSPVWLMGWEMDYEVILPDDERILVESYRKASDPVKAIAKRIFNET